MRDHYQSDTVTSAKVRGAHFILYDTVTLILFFLVWQAEVQEDVNLCY